MKNYVTISLTKQRITHMPTYALLSLAGGFLDLDLAHLHKEFDDWCVRFESIEDAQLMLDTLEKNEQIKIFEIALHENPQKQADFMGRLT